MTSRFFSHTLGQELGGVGSVAFFGTSITVADLRMSDGATLEKIGVTPDETVLPTGADLVAGRDPVLARAITLLGGTMTAEQAGKFYRQ
jgi:C-terminal processing protease CtpA/Prc